MIKVLDSFIADKIAAGEVIERPVSIVKELIENSIDAGADAIYVEIRDGGKTYIRVTDNGCGIEAEDIPKSILRHATSKIEKIDDLDNILTLGFRGEALASIAAVSRLTIVSRTEESETGFKSVFHAGQEISSEYTGANVGSTIIVEDLFYNTPARKKFLATNAREASEIIGLLENYAIYYSEIKFALVSNKATIFTTDGDSNVLNVLKSINPTNDYNDLIYIESEHVKGYISNPSVTKSTKKGQLFFVNGRMVNSSTIEKGIKLGYGDRIFSGYPIAVLFISVPPNTIDVNIHPAKKEIKFIDNDRIIYEISNTIGSAMSQPKSIPIYTEKESKIEKIQVSDNRPQGFEYQGIQGNNEKIEIREYLSNIQREEKIEEEKLEETESICEDLFDFKALQLKGYIFNSYIVFQLEDSIYIFDQHAAHERVFYEKLRNNYKSSDKHPLQILTPFTITVSDSIYALDSDWLEKLNQIGFDISDFGPNTFIIKGIPSYMLVSEAENFAQEFIDNLEDYKENKIVMDKIIMKSCKSAVKANNALSEHEINELIDSLSKCENPFSCPHGRPTFIKVTKYQIERMFKRK